MKSCQLFSSFENGSINLQTLSFAENAKQLLTFFILESSPNFKSLAPIKSKIHFAYITQSIELIIAY